MSARWSAAVAVGVLGMVASALPVRSAEEAKKPRVLMLTLSKGFEHGVVKRKSAEELSVSEVSVTQLAQATGAFTVHCTKDIQDFTKENLQKYDLVLFYTTGDLGIDKETLDYFFSDWLKQKGHGFIGIHSASDTYGDYQPYWDMVGGTFNGHPWGAGETVTISVHEPEHPTVKMWGAEFQIKDEIYQYKNWQPEKVRVLMSLNMAKCKTKAAYHVPVCWVKQYGEGRVFYSNLGHNESTWTDEYFQQHLLAGIKWAAGLTEGDATPNPELSKAQEEKAKADAGK